jgi:hypothetical protein
MTSNFLRFRFAWAGLAVAYVFAGVSASSADSPILNRPDLEAPVRVDVEFRLREINAVDEESETFGFAGVLMLAWQDDRQAFDPVEFGAPEKVFNGAYQFNEVFTGWWPQMVLANQTGALERQGVSLRIQPDGRMVHLESLVATVKSRMDMRRFPFDDQKFEAVFGVLGHDASDVVLVHEANRRDFGPVEGQSISQWKTPVVHTSVREIDFNVDAGSALISAFTLQLDMQRRPFFMLRLTAMPIGMLVMLSWSVFWMDRSSLGDRMDVSFLGILTTVAYQIMFSDTLPKISYITLSSAFLFVSFIAICATVFVNLRVSSLDRRGDSAKGDRLDRICRITFPVAYVGGVGIITGYFLLVG